MDSEEARGIIADDLLKYDNPFAEGRLAEWTAAIFGFERKDYMPSLAVVKIAMQPWLDHVHTANNVTLDTLDQWWEDANTILDECCNGEATGQLYEEYARQHFESLSS
eukprot:TRINITY_DN1494_c0_g1_i2.p4 TRINITY_DN1494_c0_g1~~TRINITY_DN1494_c0_g1_i2.p4  ORF type:complete len:108 (+),score=22.69 TRINITY_DN1494_c0_g1_i2:1482-1805(+)